MKKRPVTTFFRNIPFLRPFLSLLTINFLVIVLVLLVQSTLPPEIPLFFSKPYGEKQLATKLFLTIPPLISLLLCLTNLTITKFSTNKFLHQTLVGASATLTALSSITVLKIVLLVANL